MFPITTIGFYADQGAPQAFGKEVNYSAKPGKLHYLSAYNKGASACFIELFDAAGGVASGVPRTLPIAAGGWVGWSMLKMRRGIYVRAVNAADGGALIATDDVKFDCGFTDEIV